MRYPTQEELRRSLKYNPETGLFTWNVHLGAKSRCWLAGKKAGYSLRNGYVRIKVLGVRYNAHRLAYLYMVGAIPSVVRHVNGVKNDNRWGNLQAKSYFPRKEAA